MTEFVHQSAAKHSYVFTVTTMNPSREGRKAEEEEEVSDMTTSRHFAK